MSKHTKLKWELIPGSTCIQDDRQRNIAYVNYVDMPTDEEIGRKEAIANAKHIILAANNYHALEESKKELDFTKSTLVQYLGENKWGWDAEDVLQIISHTHFDEEELQALLATHTQQEACQGDESKDTAHTAINDNKPVEGG